MSHRILYLGLEPPSSNVIHYPVIRTERIESPLLQEALQLWPEFSHVIFTSKTAVRYWFEIKSEWDKIALAIGETTAEELRVRGISPLVAPKATQEGVIELILNINPSFLFLPRSKRARSTLTDFLEEEGIRFLALDLYDTILQKPGPIPDLNQVDEIVFTSPSTVEGFLKIFGDLPQDKILTPIGPVTKKALKMQ